MKYYVLVVFGDVEPALYGPYEKATRDGYSQLFRARGDKNGVYTLDVTDEGIPMVDTYMGPTPEEHELPDLELIKGLPVQARKASDHDYFKARVSGAAFGTGGEMMIWVLREDDPDGASIAIKHRNLLIE